MTVGMSGIMLPAVLHISNMCGFCCIYFFFNISLFCSSFFFNQDHVPVTLVGVLIVVCVTV